MKTIETGKAAVEIVAWPQHKKWKARYQTISEMENGILRLTLSYETFRDADKANTAYKRFSRRISMLGYTPPNVRFRDMNSPVTKNVFCILTTKESVFNSSCDVRKMYAVEAGRGETRRICLLVYEELMEAI